ncbi:MAG TPA: AmmeMemoRadiSam system protein A [Thermoanaerobaculia bacterium]|nr:AmmeMemoRadiSam system protein A [Thermoanaerobaculia bacterium]
MLNEEQRQRLLKLARTSIESILDGRSLPLSEGDYDEVLRRPAGAFVTLRTKRGDLRGCIGSIRAVEPLFKAVASSAVSAAFRDPRFFPVRPDEMPQLDVEISVMGPIESVRDVAEIEVGRDGLIISKGRFAGLLLPQVATEYGWDREAFLDQTCIKAGLPAGSWRIEETRIEKFAAEVFGE